MRIPILFITGLTSILLGVSCATRYSASENYKSSLADRKSVGSNRTVLLFLVDGLPIRTLKSQLNERNLPAIKNYFIGSKNQFDKARTNFPSLTYPSIASLLTERTVDQHGIYGNKIVSRNEILDFESPTRFENLNEKILGKSIFSRLKSKNQSTVALSFSFNGEATAHNDGLDLKSAVAIQTGDYAYYDGKVIEGLEIILKETKPSMWPEFIYIHLIGIDFLSHKYGPDSVEVASHLKFIDKKLKVVFNLLNEAERTKRRSVMALLTADHGYDKTIYKRLDLDRILPTNIPETSYVLNEGRYVSFRFPMDWTSQQKMQYANFLKENPSLDTIAYRENETVHLVSKSETTQINYGPAGETPNIQSQIFYPYFATDISVYFQSPGHPDIVIIPKPGVSFNHDQRGQHGGPTVDEIFVPLLIHNGQLPASSEIIPLPDILKFM